MALVYAIRGWFDAGDHELFGQVKALIERADKTGYQRNWVFPQYDRWFLPQCVFYGGLVKDLALGDVRDVVRAVAETVRSVDGDDVDYVEGHFHADAEDGSVSLTWECRDGRFYESRRNREW